jgi:diguanylate cyclase (GGDEF)-like protein
MNASPGAVDFPVPANEGDRIRALHRLDVLDQPRRADLDSLTRLAAYVCGTPNAIINLIDTDRQWPAAAHGTDPHPVPRGESMCATSIMTSDVSYTGDASDDTRWASNPHVSGELSEIRLYAAAPLILPAGEVIGTVCAFSEEPGELSRLQLERLRDIADQAVLMLELHHATDRLGHAATRDSLTGLPNRALFEESLLLAMAKHHRGEGLPAVLFLDLDDFKTVNDNYGHAAGDELLRAIADRLLDTVRASDLLARLSGDELVVLCDACPTTQGDAGEDSPGISRLVSRVRQAFVAPFELSCARLTVGASVGIAYAEHDTAEELMARADAAMYTDKRLRKS